MDKYNCWEFNNCGREKGGRKVKSHGLCPVSLITALDGVNGGKNGGRYCWSITNGGSGHKKDICIRAKDYPDCVDCPFYQKVMEEDGEDFIN